MLVLVKYRDRHGNMGSKMLDVGSPDQVYPMFYMVVGQWGYDLLWYLPECGRVRW